MNAARTLLDQVREQRRIPPHVADYVRLRVRLVWPPLRRRARRLVPGRAYRTAARAVANTTQPGTVTVAYVEGTWQVAFPFHFAAVREVAEDNLAHVCRLLECGRVPFFVREASGPGPITVGVAAEHRTGALEALSRAASREHLYARDARGGGAVALGWSARASRRLSGASRVLVYRNHRLSDDYVVGPSHACVVEFWQRAGDNLHAPPGATPGRLVADEVRRASLTVGERRYPTLSPFADHQAVAGEVPFPVDVVYTWVDDADPRWRRSFATERARLDGQVLHPEAANLSRYRNRDELRYSLRSLALYAGFVRQVFIVTAGHVPPWLDLEHPRIRVVDHAEILPGASLPTFNSHAIEARLHHIAGLAEHYLYVNDDFIFGRQVTAATFFTPNGLARIFPDERAPIPSGRATPDDRPVDSAAKNVRDLVRAHLGLRVGRKMHHAPYPQRRSVLTEMEDRFPAEFACTVGSRFRQPTDLSIASCFSHYYAFATGRAVTGHIDAEYINIATRWAPLQMRRLLEYRDRDVVCLNETDVPPGREEATGREVASFLDAFLPLPGPFEISGPRRRRVDTGRSLSGRP